MTMVDQQGHKPASDGAAAAQQEHAHVPLSFRDSLFLSSLLTGQAVQA
jgi:hypothetical protein